MAKYPNLEQFISWGQKGFFAVLDQGLFSSSNYIYNLLLARWLLVADYGAFSASFIIYLFVTGFHNAIVLEPITVLGTGKYSDKLQDYFRNQLIIHFLVTAILGALVLVFSLVLNQIGLVTTGIAKALAGVGLFLPLMLLIWVLRRFFYILQKPHLAMRVSAFYATSLLAGLFFIRHIVVVNPNLFLLYFIYGVSSLVAAFSILFGNEHKAILKFPKELKLKDLLAEQWNYGKWLVLAAFLNLIGTQTQFFFLSYFMGLDEAGIFRAIQNVSLPMAQVIVAMATLTLPAMASSFGKLEYKQMKMSASRIMVLLLAITSIYLGILFFFPKMVDLVLFGGKFEEFSWLFPILGVIPIIMAIETPYSLMNRAMRKPVYYFVSTGFTAFAGIISAPIMVYYFRLEGAIYSLISIQAISLIVNIFFFRWMEKNSRLGALSL